MASYSIQFLVVCAASLSPVVRSQQDNFVLFDFVPALDLYKTCMKVATEVGEKSADTEVSFGMCEKDVAKFADEAQANKTQHCLFFSEQMEQATLQEAYKGGPDFCKKVLMLHSYNLGTPLLNYLKPGAMNKACRDAISEAIDQGAEGTTKAEAVQANLPLTCKQTVEAVFRKNGMPIPSATQVCKPFLAKANTALQAKELDPEDTGKQFCDGNSMQAKAWEGSEKSPAPPGFPMTPGDWKPKVTLAQLQEMVRHAFATPAEAFKKYDGSGDGKMDPGEWGKMCRGFGIPTMDTKALLAAADKDKSGDVSLPEFLSAIGVTLPDLVVYSNKKHKNAAKGLKAFDKDGDGNVTPEEWEAACKELNVSPEDAKRLMPEVDEDGSGGIDEAEFKNVFGVDLPELKRRARKKHGNPEESFKAMDKNGDGKMQADEFEKACKELDIPKETAKKLLKEVDTDGSGDVDPKEWNAAMGMTAKELRHEMAKKDGADIGGAAAAMDADGDGVVTEKDLEKTGASPEEAKKLLKQMDKDGDGKVSPEEFKTGTGGDEMDKKRGFKHPKDVPAGSGGITVPEFKERAQKKYGTPQEAFDGFDTNPKDGKISPEELLEGGKALEPPLTPADAESLFPNIDKNGDGGITPPELFEILGGCKTCTDLFGVPLPEFKRRAKAKHGNPDAAFKAMDPNGDGKITPEEFKAGCGKLQPPITPEEAGPLFKLIDVKPTDEGITPEELFDAIGGPQKFGLTVPEFKERAAKKNGPKPGDAYKAMDANGDGKVSPEEFDNYCKALDPTVPPEESKPLFKELDQNKSGFIEPEEFFDEVGKDKYAPGGKDWSNAEGGPAGGATGAAPKSGGKGPGSQGVPPQPGQIGDADGDGKISPEEKLAKTKQLDADGDGVISPKEMSDAAKAGKLSKEEMKAMDADGDGNLSPEEVSKAAKATGATPEDTRKVMDKDGDGTVSPEELSEAAASGKLPPSEMKKLDADGDGKVSPQEAQAGAAKIPKKAPPKAPKEAPVSKEEMKNRMGQAFKNGKDAWDKIAGPDAKEMTPEQFRKKAADLGIPPGEADKLYKEMDKDGDGKVGKDEFQNEVGVESDEVQDRFVDSFPSSKDALKAADKDGDGNVSEAELEEVMQKKLGLTPENAKKAAKEMMKDLDPQGTGKIQGKAFEDATKAKADDLAGRISDKMGSSGDAFKKWDKDGDGKVTEEEMVAGAKEMGISEDAARDMFKAQDKDGDGVMNANDFARSFGMGPDEVMERCFQYYGNPWKAFDAMDTNHDGLLSPAEFKIGGAKMKLKPDQIDRLFGDMDTNTKEATPGHLSKWEWYDYLDYAQPAFRSFDDGYGDVDPFGVDHKKFNELPHTAPKVARSLMRSERSSHTVTAGSKKSEADVAKVKSHTVANTKASGADHFLSPKEVAAHHAADLKKHHLNSRKAKGAKKNKKQHGH